MKKVSKRWLIIGGIWLTIVTVFLAINASLSLRERKGNITISMNGIVVKKSNA